MAEWVDATVADIRRLHPERVLEIGCGTGLLLARLAPDCVEYWGTDYSQQVIRRSNGSARPCRRSAMCTSHTAWPTTSAASPPVISTA